MWKSKPPKPTESIKFKDKETDILFDLAKVTKDLYTLRDIHRQELDGTLEDIGKIPLDQLFSNSAPDVWQSTDNIEQTQKVKSNGVGWSKFNLRESIKYYISGAANVQEKEQDNTTSKANSKNLTFEPLKTSKHFPFSRMAMASPQHLNLFMFQLRHIRKQGEYFFYNRWVLWLEQEIKDLENESLIKDKKRLQPAKIIQTNRELKNIFINYSEANELQMKPNLTFFKLGFIPSRTHEFLTTGATISFQVSLDKFSELLSYLTLIVLNEDLYSPETISIEVCGISNCNKPLYSLVNLWLVEYPAEPFDCIHLVELLVSLIPEHLREELNSAILTANKTCVSVPLFECKN